MPLIVLGHLGIKLCPGRRDGIYIGHRYLVGPLVPVQENHILRSLRSHLVRNHASVVDCHESPVNAMPQILVLDVNPGQGLQGILGILFSIAEKRNNACPGLGLFRGDFFRGLQYREVELGDKRLVRPLRAFLIVIVELAASRKNEEQYQKQDSEQIIHPGVFR